LTRVVYRWLAWRRLARGVSVMSGRLVYLGRTSVVFGLLVVACLLGSGAVDQASASAELIWAGPVAHDDLGLGPQHYGAVACARTSQCTAVDETGGEVTFDPRTSGVVTAAAIDSGTQAVYALACPTSTQCTAVDLNGRAATFNPRHPTAHHRTRLSRNQSLVAVACPSRRQCTAVTANRYEITFDPRKHGSARRHVSLRTQAGTGITGIACPSLSECVAVDGAGEVVGFDPRAPGKLKPVRLLNDSAVAVACPSAAECVVVGFGGERITFSMDRVGRTPTLNPNTVSRAKVDTQQPNALACPSVTYCVLVDSAGRAVEFDPGGSRAIATSPVVGDSLSAVACKTSAACVAVDSVGDAFLGGGRLPAVPVARGLPRVSGMPLQGDLLKGSGSRWSPHATSLHPQWERCSSSGRACREIAGATSLRYRLTAADVGHTIRLVERAANQAGFGAAVVSRATGSVRRRPRSRSGARARVIDAEVPGAAVDSWLPDISTATWRYNWTESHYNPTPGTIEDVSVQSATGAGFVLVWTGVPSQTGGPITDQGTVSFQNTETGLVNTNWSSLPPPPGQPILCGSRTCPNSLASAYFNVIWGSRNPVLAAPLLQGASWPSTGGASDGVLSANTYLGDQLVTVPAFPRPVTAAVVRSKITQRHALAGPYGSGIRTTWWVYGVGPVKVVFDHGGRGPITTVTLLATDLRPLPPPPDVDYFPLEQAHSGLYSYTNTRYLKKPEVERVTVAPLRSGTANVSTDSVSGPIKVNGDYVFSLRLTGGLADLSGTSSATTLLKFPKLGHGLHFFTPIALMTYGFGPVLPAYPEPGDTWSENPGALAFYGVTGQTRIVGLRSVQVPAGSFDALELTSTLTQRGSGYGSGVRTMWFAPGVGLVKLEFRHRDGSVSLVQLLKSGSDGPSVS